MRRKFSRSLRVAGGAVLLELQPAAHLPPSSFAFTSSHETLVSGWAS